MKITTIHQKQEPLGRKETTIKVMATEMKATTMGIIKTTHTTGTGTKTRILCRYLTIKKTGKDTTRILV